MAPFNFYHSFLLLCLTLPSLSQTTEQHGYVCVPVADLVGMPHSLSKPDNIKTAYTQIPLAGGNVNTHSSCPRIHQLLFNEKVRILEQRNNEVMVEVPHIFFIVPPDIKTPHCTYWTLAENIISDTHLDTAFFPSPLHFRDPKKTTFDNVVTLAFPWYDKLSQRTFSAGTRFVYNPQKRASSCYQIYLYEPAQKKWSVRTLPKKYVIPPLTTQQEKIQAFVGLIRSWAHAAPGVIPYVWGGCSVGALCADVPFKEQKEVRNKTTYSWFNRSDCTATPYIGLDCTGLVARAAQICGIPYFLKNSTTIVECLKELTASETVENGDLIWVKGHIMVVSDVKRNLLVEARGYPSGFGKVHEIALNKVFKDIATYKELQTAAVKRTPLVRIKKDGSPIEPAEICKLFKLAQVWNHTL